MHKGTLIRLRTRALPLLLALLALAGGLFLPTPEAGAKLDPLRVVTAQIVRPNILIVFDTSGSMMWVPSSNDTVGGDCYEGQGVCAPGLSPTCPDASACSPVNTCFDGSTSCTPGTNNYCTDGNACTNGRLCGTAGSQTVCPASTRTCQDGTGCYLCQDGVNRCSTDADCPAVHGTCATQKHCKGTTGTNCTADSNCTVATCDTGESPNRCELSTSCGAGCYGAGTYCGGSGSQCRWTLSPECTNHNQCRKCVQTCANSRSTECTSDNDCPLVANTCQTGASPQCASCNYWCTGNTEACADAKYCNNTGSITACAQECNDATNPACFAIEHCGAGPCTMPSSRMAIAKKAIKDLVAGTSDIINYGFVAFQQDNYFPYQSSGTTTETREREFELHELRAWGGWNWANDRPASSFTRRGVTYTLKAAGTDNSRYRCGRGWGRRTQHDYCGRWCTISGRSCRYDSSIYTYQRTIPASSPKTCYANAYYGQTITCDSAHGCPQSGSSTGCSGLTVSYYQFPYNYGPTSGSYVNGATSSGGSACSHSDNKDGAVRVNMISSANEDSETQRAAVVDGINGWLAPQVEGGLVAVGYTPTGCALQYNTAGTTGPTSGVYYDAYTYLSDHKAADTMDACRTNAVILVTDGEPNGPGDSSCGSTSCASSSLTGCTCRAVLAAKHFYANKNAKVYTIGFGAETTGSATLDNIAKAGGVAQRADGHYAYYASNEAELGAALREAAFLAAKGDYATAQPTVATSSGATLASDYALLSSTEFPTWKGHLRAYQLDTNTAHTTPTAPALVWDAGSLLAARTWSTRRVWTSDPSASHALVPFVVSGATNASTLLGLGLGATVTEADAIAQFSLGAGRSWSLGPMLNSTPASHGKGINLNLPGHAAFLTSSNASSRPKMVYVGSDDGMLHAFYLETGAWGTAGEEAWAYVPPDLLPALTKQWLAGGQPSDPADHVFGVANSPKIMDVCGGACSSASDWKTVLVSGEGPGGKGYFALDITAMPNAATPFQVLWHTMSISSYASTVGQSWSVPTFAFTGGSPVTSLLLFGSGYDADLADAYDQGAWLHVANALTGAPHISSPHLTAPSSPVATYAVIADTVVATTAAIDATTTPLAVAAYQADLGGRIWRLANGSSAPGSTPFYDLGVGYPFYYSPAAIVQSGTKVYLAANDSTYDDLDMNRTGSNTPKLTLLTDEGGTRTNMTISANGTSYTNSVPLTSVCKTGCSGGTCSCSSAANRFTAAARPVSSPVIIQNSYSGQAQYQAAFLIYQPVPNSCVQGNSYVVVMDITDTPVTQSYVKDLGIGKAAGLSLGAGGQMLVAKSGAGTSAASVQVAAGSAQAGGPITATPTARVMGILEVDN